MIFLFDLNVLLKSIYKLIIISVLKLKELIINYQDFPKEGIVFRDLLGILQEPDIFKELISEISLSKIIKNSDALISIDARGFIFGSALALHTSKPMVFARKKGKLPGVLIEKNYDLEYGNNTLSIQKECIQKYNKFAIIDDLLATGGTASCVSEIVKSLNKEISGLIVIAELKNLNGRKKFDFPVESQVIY